MKRLLLALVVALLFSEFAVEGATDSMLWLKVVLFVAGILGHHAMVAHWEYRPGRYYWQMRGKRVAVGGVAFS